MKIVKVKVENFRGYSDEVSVDFGDLTAFVGKNDVGKSTILEALDIFFGEEIIKFDKGDINKLNNQEEDINVKISVVFDDLKDEVVIDSDNITSLSEEYLLNKDRQLEFIKIYSSSGKAKTYLKAYHPINEECKDLLLKKIADLRKIVKENEIDCNNQAKSAVLRKAIREYYKDKLVFDEVEIDLTKEDCKNIYEKLEKEMPLYFLFQSDRSNNDGDSEIQNPLKFAVQEILKDQTIEEKLNQVSIEIKKALDEVVATTLDKLKEMNEEVANSLNPNIPDKLKWEDVFKKLSITGDNDIPINKRGSGVKRLILLNFFRAEAERKRKQNSKTNIIYAIEEPETSQHEEHQKMLIESLKKLSNENGIQVILTTHSPIVVKSLDFTNVRIVKKENGKTNVINFENAVLPIPSLNEANYIAFGRGSEEYHDELYGHIEYNNLGKTLLQDTTYVKNYIRINKKKEKIPENIPLSTYIRHQIHHPENKENILYTEEELQKSIEFMREFIFKNCQGEAL